MSDDEPTGAHAARQHRRSLGGYLSDGRHGPLPALLLLLTVATGVVDAVSILALGRVFVANMTGNVVFIGFALAGAPGFSLSASLVALVGFLLGAGAGGRVGRRHGGHRGHLLRDVVAVELLLVLAAAAATTWIGSDPRVFRNGAVALLALALGLQNAAVRRLAVPDLTTTVLTMSLTGLGADLRVADSAATGRRVLSVLAMLAGGFGGAILTLRGATTTALLSAAALLAVTALSAAVASRRPAPWQFAARP